LLLLQFFIRKTENKVQKKVIGVLIDNSRSLSTINQPTLKSLITALSDLKTTLSANNFDVEFESFAKNTDIDSVKFNVNSSNLSKLITTFKSKNEGRNITDLILISDGINNQGISPSSLKYPYPIHTIGLGDTAIKKDIILKYIIANNIAYLGNDFMVQAEVFSYGFQGKNASVSIIQDGKAIQTKTINLSNSTEPTLVEFKINSHKKGLNRYKIVVSQQSGEVNIRNNSQEFFIDIIDGHQEILLLAAAPHPDIKALKAIVENNENYTLNIKIGNQNQKVDLSKKYDLAIFHQLPDELASFESEIKALKASGIPIFYIIGNLSSIAAINALNKDIEIGASSLETDKVTGSFNSLYKAVDLDVSALSIIEKLPPIIVPYGEFKTRNEVLLFQKLGSTTTQKPLLTVNNNIPKSAYFMGEGLWGWRMEEYSQTDKNEVVDNLFTKIIQLIATKDDTRKLRIYPKNKEFDLGNPVILETEVYNEIFQKIYNNKINLQIIDEKNTVRKFEYTNLEGSPEYSITGLTQGIYKYNATTFVSGKTETASGEFIIKNVDFEMENLQADFGELQKIAKNTGGNFYRSNQIGELQNMLSNKKYEEKIISEENLDELISWPWLLFLLLLLASIEWASRKYLGGY
jgi:hypothetical protein